MPSLGADMDEGTLLEWLVKPGDTVHRGEIVAVVDTAKSAVEVECFSDGVVQALVVNPGEVVPVGAVLAQLAENGSARSPESAPAEGTPAETATAEVALDKAAPTEAAPPPREMPKNSSKPLSFELYCGR